MRVFKWLGYLVALVIVLLVTTVFFIDSIVRTAVEEVGTRVVKARVDLDDAKVQFFPLAVELRGLRVTNPQKPMTNVLDAERILAQVDVKPLLAGKIIVDEAALEGMRSGTARKVSGAVPGLTPAPDNQPGMLDQMKADLKLPTFEIPSPDDVLKRVDLKTEAQARALEQKIKSREDYWKSRIKEVASKDKLDAYKQRIEQLKGDKSIMGRLNAVRELKQIRDDIRRDIDTIKNLRTELQRDVASLRQDILNLKKAPQEDLQKAMALVNLDGDALQGVAEALFGPQVKAWLGRLEYWYTQLEPYLKGSDDGQAAAEPDTTDYSDGLPKFLVRHMTISGEVPLMNTAIPVQGELKDLTHQPQIYGKPLELALKSASEALGKLSLQAVADHVRPDAGKDLITFDASGLNVGNLSLGDPDTLPVLIEAATAALSGQAVIENGGLDLKTKVVLDALKTQVLRQENLSRVQQAMVAALQNVSGFDIDVLARGALGDPKVSVKSTLDRVLSGALKGVVKQEAEKLRTQLESRLSAMAAEKIGQLNTATGPLAGLDGLLKDQMGKFGDLTRLIP